MAKPLHIQSCPSTMAISEGALVEALHQQSFHSSGFFSASAAAASAAATIVAGTPFASRFLFGQRYQWSSHRPYVYARVMTEFDAQ